MDREAMRVTKTDFWQVCKIIRSEKCLTKAVKFVFDRFDHLQDLEGLSGTKLAEKQEEWKESQKNNVRIGINNQRNYVVGEIQEVAKEAFAKGKFGEWPTKEEMLMLALRQGFEEPEATTVDGEDDPTSGEDDPPNPEAVKPNQEAAEKYQRMLAMMVKYWNVLLPKVCGSSYWSVTKRCYGLISNHGPKPTKSAPDPAPHVHISAEAFLVWVWENYCDRWVYQFECNRDSEKVNQKSPKMQCEYTNPKGGNKQFGGITQKGIQRLQELKVLIKQNREENMKDLLEVEKVILPLVYKENKRGPIDNKKAAKKEASLAESEAEDEEEDDDDENDFESW